MPGFRYLSSWLSRDRASGFLLAVISRVARMPRTSNDTSLVNQPGTTPPLSRPRPSTMGPSMGKLSPKRRNRAAAKAGTKAREAKSPVDPRAWRIRAVMAVNRKGADAGKRER